MDFLNNVNPAVDLDVDNNKSHCRVKELYVYKQKVPFRKEGHFKRTIYEIIVVS